MIYQKNENILDSAKYDYNRPAKHLLVGAINGLAWEAKKNKKKLLKTTKEISRARLSADKNHMKSLIRHRLLAYAFLTGKTYLEVEQKCSVYNRPSSSFITQIIEDLGTIFHPVTRYRCDVSLEQIQKWLEA